MICFLLQLFGVVCIMHCTLFPGELIPIIHWLQGVLGSDLRREGEDEKQVAHKSYTTGVPQGARIS
jgi:hypothetical protein